MAKKTQDYGGIRNVRGEISKIFASPISTYIKNNGDEKRSRGYPQLNSLFESPCRGSPYA